MILGVDHLAQSARTLAAARTELLARGYTEVFTAAGVTNHPAKRPLLADYRPLHDLALFRPAAGGVAIEVTCHGEVLDDRPGPYGIDDDGAIRLRSARAAEDRAFFVGAMKFRDEAGELHLHAPIAAWRARLRISSAAASPPVTLDAAGHPCLAFLCRGIDDDLATVRRAGATDLTEPFPLTVNDRPLVVAMFRTPGGALCELIETR